MTLRRAVTRLTAGPSRLFSTSRTALQAPVVVPTKPSSQSSASLPSAPTDQLTQLRRYPNHPLLQFFHLHRSTFPSTLAHPPTTATSESDHINATSPSSIVIDMPHAVHRSDMGKDGNGRSWVAAELRLKSSKDLHTLWYVLLQERNRLATSWEELVRIGGRQAAKMWNESLSRRNHRVRKSMARIKLVLNERRLALMQAQQHVRQGVQEPSLVAAPEADEGDLFEESVQESKSDVETPRTSSV